MSNCFSSDRRVKLALAAIGAIWVLYPAIYVTLTKTPLVWQGSDMCRRGA